MTTIEFTVHAKPAPQGSKVPRVSSKGKPYMIESSKERVRSWRGAVVEDAEKTIGAYADAWLPATGWEPLTGPLLLSVVFTFPRPASHYGTGRNRNTLKPSALTRPVSKNLGDLSKLVRATEDALTDAGVWTDDSLVAECYAAKVYPGGHVHAQQVPGAWISVTEITEWITGGIA